VRFGTIFTVVIGSVYQPSFRKLYVIHHSIGRHELTV